MCVYAIKSISQPEKIYIGSTTQYFKRLTQHKGRLKANTHENQKLQNHVNKYGIDDLSFEILREVFDSKHLLAIEQHHLTLLEPYFNIRKDAHAVYGISQSEETKRKRIESRNRTYKIKGMPIREVGNNWNDESRELMRETMKERYKPYSNEHWTLIKEFVEVNQHQRWLHEYKCTKCDIVKLLDRRIQAHKCKCQHIKPISKNKNNTLSVQRWYRLRKDCDVEMSESVESFISIVGEMPIGYKIIKKQDNKPYSKDNFEWVNTKTYAYQQNLNKKRIDNGSGYTGITFDKQQNMYRARVKINGKNISIGRSKDPKEARDMRMKYLIDKGLIKSV